MQQPSASTAQPATSAVSRSAARAAALSGSARWRSQAKRPSTRDRPWPIVVRPVSWASRLAMAAGCVTGSAASRTGLRGRAGASAGSLRRARGRPLASRAAQGARPSAHTRSGATKAARSATSPPNELPTIAARSMDSSSMVRRTSAHGASWPCGSGASPKPGNRERRPDSRRRPAAVGVRPTSCGRRSQHATTPRPVRYQPRHWEASATSIAQTDRPRLQPATAVLTSDCGSCDARRQRGSATARTAALRQRPADGRSHSCSRCGRSTTGCAD